MNIQILHLLEGARAASGLTVIIDVFRAFSLECYLYALGAETIFPVDTLEKAYQYREKYPGSLLAGERKGKKCAGFDFGNSPSAIINFPIRGKKVIHTTSAGTQGIANAHGAEEIITGSLVNASAVAQYIRAKNPETVSLVCMRVGGRRRAKEDYLCAEYIKSLLKQQPFNISRGISNLRYDGGTHFFDPDRQDVFPKEDFHLCVKYDQFPFVIRIRKNDAGDTCTEKIDVL